MRYAERVRDGQWFHPLRESLQTLFDRANLTLDGLVRVRLYRAGTGP